MNRGIIALVIIVIVGAAGLYWIKMGPSMLVRSPADERVAFVSNRGGSTDIWTMKSDGSDTRQVTKDAADDQSPVWSPDGRELAFLSNRYEDRYQVFVSAWDGRYDNKLTSSSGTKDQLSWSDNGDELTYLSSAKVYTMLRHGTEEEQYLPPEKAPSIGGEGMSIPYVFAAWNSTRDLLLTIQEADSNRMAMVVPLGKEPPVDMASLKAVPLMAARNLDAAWSPSGKQVVVAFTGVGGKHGIAVYDLGAGTRKVICAIKGDELAACRPTWSPSGDLVAFEMWEIQDGVPIRPKSLYTISANGGEPKLIVDGHVEDARWSPDGSQLALAMKGSEGSRDIWRVNADGSGATNLTNGKGDNYNPCWSPSPSASAR